MAKLKCSVSGITSDGRYYQAYRTHSGLLVSWRDSESECECEMDQIDAYIDDNGLNAVFLKDMRNNIQQLSTYLEGK